jgi:hypothetical protein
MTTPIPLQFLVGLTRLIAVYFALRCLDGFAGMMLGYQMQLMMAPSFVGKMPSVLALYLPSVAFYLALTVATWIAAPSIVRFSLGSSPQVEIETPRGVCWNEVMIFLTGVILLGWGLARVSDSVAAYLREKAKTFPYQGMSSVEVVHLLISAVFIGFGGLMMARFPSIYQWMQKRSKEHQSSAPALNLEP